MALAKLGRAYLVEVASASLSAEERDGLSEKGVSACGCDNSLRLARGYVRTRQHLQANHFVTHVKLKLSVHTGEGQYLITRFACDGHGFSSQRGLINLQRVSVAHQLQRKTGHT